VGVVAGAIGGSKTALALRGNAHELSAKSGVPDTDPI
jgi:hypothetical protein